MNELINLGTGGLGGLIVALFTLLGFRERIKTVEEKKQDKEICKLLHEHIDIGFKDVKTVMKEEFNNLANRIEKINNR